MAAGTRALAMGLLVVAAGGIGAGAQQQASQTAAPKTLFERYTQPIELYKSGLGTFTRPISSSNKDAQAFSDQGFQMMYAFAKPEAIRSFREAWKRDPDCAICYWGEAWAWGSYLNSAMNAEEAPHAYAAVQKAIALKDKANARERALIDALAVRYVETFDPEKRIDQDKAYAEAIGKVAASYPDDLDIATLHADALFLLEPRRGTRDIKSESVQRLHRVLERILAKDVHHPGACHLYVHATESTVVPERAAACAEFLGRSIPGASHINHMPSHTWNEVGRWGDSVRANLEAWHSDLKAAIGEGFAIYPAHNLHMLLYAASMDGQGAIAMQAGKDYTKLTGETYYQVLTMIRFGRFDEVLEVKNRPTPVILGGFWDFAQGYAELRTGNADFARVYLDRVKKAADTSKDVFREHTARNLLGTVAGILEGEILLAAGDTNGAIAALEHAVAIEDQLGYDEPEPLPFAARHWLGAAFVEAKRFEDAERVYREELADHPHNGWSLLGLQKSLAGRGTSSREVDEDLAKSWSRADTWIRASRF